MTYKGKNTKINNIKVNMNFITKRNIKNSRKNMKIEKNTKRNNNIKINKKTFTKSLFYSIFSINFQDKFLQNTEGSNIIIMYDLYAPNGKNAYNKSKNFKYIHYLKVGDKVIVPYAPSTPPKGTHTYIIKKIELDEMKIKILLSKLIEIGNNRKHKKFLINLVKKKLKSK
tara:strand:+ start:1832 stop:2341 length:510 start_codon:yes stop_codon:yes gene_type:complete